MTIPSVIKQPSESRLYTMDFSALLAPGEVINGITSVTKDKVTASDLVIGASGFSGPLVQFRLSAGLAGTKYKVTAVVTTSDGNTLEGEGYIQLEDI